MVLIMLGESKQNHLFVYWNYPDSDWQTKQKNALLDNHILSVWSKPSSGCLSETTFCERTSSVCVCVCGITVIIKNPK